MVRTYTVHRLEGISTLPAGDPAWDALPALSVDSYVWPEFAAYRPVTSARLAFLPDSGRLALRMQTDEKPLLARFERMNDNVFMDSCMEFFLQPDPRDARYLNFEWNPKGTLLLGIGPDRASRERIPADCGRFAPVSLCRDDFWTLCWEIPVDFLREHGFAGISGLFRGNFYKCGEETVHPHYGSWNPVGTPSPDFHVPAFFGDLILEG